jgi:transmembrane sensor
VEERLMQASATEMLREQAVDCFLCLDDPAGEAAEKNRWRTWLEQSPVHRAAYDAQARLWRGARTADLQAAGIASSAELLAELNAPPPVARRSLFRPAAAALLAAASIATVCFTVPALQPGAGAAPRIYETARAERKRITLADGSEVMLGPESRLLVRYQAGQRSFLLQVGEALFTATHDTKRPFRVAAGQGVIEDLGTVFNVRTGEEGVTVTVVEGAVAVGKAPPVDERVLVLPAVTAAVRLGTDQQVTYARNFGTVQTVDAASVASWRDGQLAYNKRPLREVVADLRRYSKKTIVVQDHAVDDLSFTGTVGVEQLDQWAAVLTRLYPLNVTVLKDQLVIAPRRKA